MFFGRVLAKSVRKHVVVQPMRFDFTWRCSSDARDAVLDPNAIADEANAHPLCLRKSRRFIAMLLKET
jgi:hypothetical protein